MSGQFVFWLIRKKSQTITTHRHFGMDAEIPRLEWQNLGL